tara:strand:- start:14620 stop:16263 length:1644 start_codon:yes stop_codon:yes gene_type:complete
MTEDDSYVVEKRQCPVCAEEGRDSSGDNLAVYNDGHAHCFACGHHAKSVDDPPSKTNRPRKAIAGLIADAEYRPLQKRGITEETARKFGYQVGSFSGRTVQVAPYRRSGVVVAQKLRFANKDFTVVGDLKGSELFGQHLWRDGGRMLTITEGEIDAMSVSQAQGNTWPVVSLPTGANSAVKAVSQEIEWIEKFETVILMFDMDEPGQEAALAVAGLLTPGKAKIASLPLKDPNDMLVAGRSKEIVDAIWGARTYRPDGLVSVSDIRDRIDKPKEMGLPWFDERLNAVTWGRHLGETIGLGAGTGVGKTDLLTQQMEYDINTLGEQVGSILLEQPPEETALRVAGKAAGRMFHIPDGRWTEEEREKEVDALDGQMLLYDSFGVTDWDVVKGKIRYMAHSGIRLIYLDHLTALADPSNERESLETIVAEMSKLAKELQIIIHFVSHLASPEGKSHEEGGRVTIKHFKGARAIGFWAHSMIGLERDQQNDDPELAKMTTMRVLKHRYDGRAVGKTFGLSYDDETGRLFAVDLPEKKPQSPFPAADDDGEY